MSQRAIVLLSGGMDSATLLWDMKRHYEVLALGFNYNQRHQHELVHAAKLALEADVEFEIVDITSIGLLLHKGSQTGGDSVPDGHYTESSMKTTIVPNRNAILLSIAAGIAISRGIKSVHYAAHAGDHAIYPDCRPEFFYKFREALELGNGWETIILYAPFIYKDKADIVRLGVNLGVPYALTYSCYKGQGNHCGTCGTCTERKEAFALAGVPDPTTYAEV